MTKTRLLGHSRIWIVTTVLLIAVVVSAGTPVRLTDVTGVGTLGSGATLFVRAGNYAYFRAQDADHGWELWRTDGTPEGTQRVTDVVPGPNPPQADLTQWFPLAALGDTVFFQGWDAAHGWELWKTDGTPSGTRLVKDLTPGPISSNPQLIAATDTRLFFSANAYPASLSLFVTDGSEAGTVPVKAGLRNPVRMAALGEKALILNYDNGANIWWVSDGTESGTGPFQGVAADSEPWSMRGESVAFGGGYVYFTSCSDVQGCEVWRSDGTGGGTTRVTDLVPPNPSYPRPEVWAVAVTSTTLFVHVYPVGPYQGGPSLWAVDLGTTVTTKIGDFRADLPLVVGNVLYFRGPYRSDIGWELWKSDGTPEGTQPLDLVPGPNSSDAGPLGQAGGKVYARGLASDSVNGVRPHDLWASDGTISGSRVILQLMPPEIESGANFGGGLDLNGRFVFGASELTGRTGIEPWVSDGTPEGTRSLGDLNAESRGADPAEIVALGGSRCVLRGCDPDHGCELWTSDGTPGGTALAADISSGWSSSYPVDLTAFNGAVFLRGQSGYRLFRFDGTSAQEIPVGTYSLPQPYYLTVAGQSLYFTALDSGTGRELWAIGSSGTPHLVKDLYPAFGSSNPYNLTPVGRALFFVAYDNLFGEAIWKTDGTEVGTVAIKTNSTDYMNPYSMAPLGTSLFFRAYHQDSGAELWKTDGTPGGTALFKDINPGFGNEYPGYPDSSGPYNLTAAGDRLFFTAFTNETGRELWTSDGTVDGTHLVKDIVDEAPYFSTSGGLGPVQFSAMSAVDGTLFFTTWEPETGVELWRSDGTEGGTVVVRDIANEGDAFPASLVPYRRTLFFTAWDAELGRELWQTDGTHDGTVVVADLAAGKRSSSPTELSVVRDQLFFSANDGVTGRELWRMPVPDVHLATTSVPEGGSATLTATATDPDGGGISFDWDLDGDGVWEYLSLVPNATFSAAGLDGPGTTTVRVRVTDATGVMAVDHALVTVTNVAPQVSAGADAALELGATLARAGSFTDPGPDTWTATVNYGDGSGSSALPLTGKTFAVTHTFTASGTFTVTVVVRDDDGGEGPGSFTVEVGTTEDSITDLIGDVEQLLQDGSLKNGQAKSLIGKLQRALDALALGDTKKAITMLESFIQEVEAYLRAGVLTHEEGDPLLAQARAALASIH